VVVVSAPTRLPYRAKLVVGTAERREVVVPALSKSVTVTSSKHRIGQIATALGGAAIGTGIGLGLVVTARDTAPNVRPTIHDGHRVPCGKDEEARPWQEMIRR